MISCNLLWAPVHAASWCNVWAHQLGSHRRKVNTGVVSYRWFCLNVFFLGTPGQPPSKPAPQLSRGQRAHRQCMIAGFRVHETTHLGSIDEDDPKHETYQLIGVLGCCHFGLHVDSVSSSHVFFRGGAIAASLVHVCIQVFVHLLKSRKYTRAPQMGIPHTNFASATLKIEARNSRITRGASPQTELDIVGCLAAPFVIRNECCVQNRKGIIMPIMSSTGC